MHNYGGVSSEERVRELCSAGESFTVEFKRGARGELNDQAIVVGVVCLANGAGGTLLLGVDDDGSITGLDPRHYEITDPHRLRAMILNNTEPPVATDVAVLVVEGHTVATVEVPRAPSPIGTKSETFETLHQSRRTARVHPLPRPRDRLRRALCTATRLRRGAG